jgi:hypothetical protein
MSIETTLTSLLDDESIKYFPLVAPHDEPAPFVVYQEIKSNQNIRTHSGDAIAVENWQIACWAYTYEEASTLCDQVKALLHLNVTDFMFSEVTGRFDLPDPDSGLYRKILESTLWESA